MERYTIMSVALILMIVFFFPKDSTQEPSEAILDKMDSYEKIDCFCFGFEIWQKPSDPSKLEELKLVIVDYTCWGIPFCKEVCMEKADVGWKETTCELQVSQ